MRREDPEMPRVFHPEALVIRTSCGQWAGEQAIRLGHWWREWYLAEERLAWT
jgi:hypothetical protein